MKKKTAIATTEKSSVGRPSKYRPAMCGQVVELMQEGASKTEVCVALGIGKTTLMEWTTEKSPVFIEEFANAIKEGELRSEAWWEKKARLHLIDEPGQGKLNTALWFINMKNRFGWRDQVDHKLSGSVTVTHEQALDALIGKPKEPIDVEHERITSH